jgi:ERCC4-type nuclease
MKLDKMYFTVALHKILTSGSAEKSVEILKQIARDAAEQQRGKCVSHCEHKTKRGCVNCPEEMEFPNA